MLLFNTVPHVHSVFISAPVISNVGLNGDRIFQFRRTDKMGLGDDGADGAIPPSPRNFGLELPLLTCHHLCTNQASIQTSIRASETPVCSLQTCDTPIIGCNLLTMLLELL